MSLPKAVCDLCGLELVAAARNADAIEVVREVFAQHLESCQALSRQDAVSTAADWARRELEVVTA
ncbi:MAG: hypothetical protein JST54_28995 [Deltaproteobacteria bacterium]|nr:hypothetical protein [Deltaproteobacteria bacterium]